MEIRLWPDPVLSRACRAVEENEFGPKLSAFAGELVAAMASGRGVGLAAPQVGVASRLFAMTFPEDPARAPLVACNPVLALSGGTVLGSEGCLSLPGVYLRIARAEAAVMRYFTPEGAEGEVELSGLDARVAQHETDHTLGVMFMDRLPSRQMRRAALREWEKVRAVRDRT